MLSALFAWLPPDRSTVPVLVGLEYHEVSDHELASVRHQVCWSRQVHVRLQLLESTLGHSTDDSLHPDVMAVVLTTAEFVIVLVFIIVFIIKA